MVTTSCSHNLPVYAGFPSWRITTPIQNSSSSSTSFPSSSAVAAGEIYSAKCLFSLRSSFSFGALHSGLLTASSWPHNILQQKRNRQSVCICSAARYLGRGGRVGTHKREGNVSLALFGATSRKRSPWKNLDFTKSASGMLPYAVFATAIAALLQPTTFAWVSKDYYAPALGGIMLSIGLQLSPKDFAVALYRPLPVLIGYMAHYFVKPLLALLIVRALQLPSSFASGFILTASVAGAQLASYASYLGGGDVALSIVLTSLTTVTSVVMTPIITRLLIGSVVPVDAIAMAVSITQVVLCPVIVGLVLNTYAKSAIDIIRPFMPFVAMICTSICIGGPLSLNRDQIASLHGINILFPVMIFHTGAFTCGYWISRIPLLRQDEKVSRTLSLSTGMQSSTLAGLLATQFLGGSHAVPPACSVVVMAMMGLSLASFWGKGRRLRNFIGDKNGNTILLPIHSFCTQRLTGWRA